MGSTSSATKLSDVLASLNETMGEFRAETEEIEASFFELVAGITEFGHGQDGGDARLDATPDCQTGTLESIAVERLETLDRSLAEQRDEFLGRQDRLANDVGQLRELVDRQIQLFTAWIDSTPKPKPGQARRKGRL